jgi:hypothetical protein
MPVVDNLAEECIESPFDILLRARTAAPLAQQFLTVKNPAEIEPWRSLLVRNTPSTLPRGLPVFLAQGVSHGFAGAKSADQAVAWIADRFAGRPAPSDCGG